jgi:hypothetical protein
LSLNFFVFDAIFINTRNWVSKNSKPDEDALVLGTKLYVKTALAFLKEGLREEKINREVHMLCIF